jgi:hypothetical protein
MRKGLLIALVVVLIVLAALPVRAQTVSASTAAGITLSGEKVSLGLGGSYAPFANNPTSLDGGWNDPTWWVGVSEPFGWVVSKCGIKLKPDMQTLADRFSGGVFVARSGQKPFGGLYLKLTAVSVPF